jgi:hypothetical protein
MPKPEKLTLVIEPEARHALTEWAREEDRPVANLLRQIVNRSLAQRRQSLQHGEAA